MTALKNMSPGSGEAAMINIDFTITGSREWMGGLNYLKNLLYAISILEDKKIQPILFVGNHIDIDMLKIFEPCAKIVTSSLFDRGSISWFIDKTTKRLLAREFLFERLIKKYDIPVHVFNEMSTNLPVKRTVNWIPDFQYLHLPEMFLPGETAVINKRFLNIITKSDIVILSSNSALDDYKILSLNNLNKARVLPFVAQVNEKIYQNFNKEEFEKKYNFKGKFFYLPNQFWKHKNHKVVFEAINILKSGGKKFYCFAADIWMIIEIRIMLMN